MKSFKSFINEEKNSSYTKEMKEWFLQRTKNHIQNVQDFAGLVEKEFPVYAKGLIKNTLKHDKNKFEEPSLTPYIHITWKYKMKDEGKEYEIPETINDYEATEYHVKTNDHHPEYWTDQTETINKNDRDKLSKLIDGTKMSNRVISEMCSDWMTMSFEKGGDPRDWAKSNINVRWKFSKDQEKMIYKILNKIWEIKENNHEYKINRF